MINYQRKNPGFSLVEVLVATSILLLIIVGPMTMIVRMNNSDRLSSEYSVATSMAQEGVEIATAARDYRYLVYFNQLIYGGGVPTYQPWQNLLVDSGFSACMTTSGCRMEMGNDATTGNIIVAACNDADPDSCRLYKRTSMGSERSYFTHTTLGSDQRTPFVRKIYFHRTPATGKVQSIRVESVVTWRTGSLISGQSVKATSYLYNTYDTN